MASIFRPVYTDKKTGRPKRLKRWYAKFRDAAGVNRKVPLSPNKAAAQRMLADLLAGVERERAGLADPTTRHATTPLAVHLDAWAADLGAGEATAKHVRQTAGWTRKVVAGAGAVFPTDLTAEAVRGYLAGLREDRPAPDLDPAKDAYTRDELAALLGVKAFSVPSLVRRHRLAAVGNGKARRYPAETAARLLADRARGMSAKAANHYLAAVQQFSRWLAKKTKATDPLEELKPFNVEADRRRERRVLSADELRRLILAAGASGRTFRGLSGRDRAALYATDIGTGFRAEELSCLTPGHFNLDAANPHVYLSAAETKNGKAVEQPLPSDVAAELRSHLAGRPEREPVWPGSWWTRAADMIRLDLEAAGIPFVTDGRDGPLYADLHALRHSFVALLDRSGATLREAMQLARHSDPKLTMRTYGRLRLADLGGAVSRLPSLTPIATHGPRPEALPATGTDGRHVPKHVPTAASGRVRLRTGDESDASGPLADTPDFPGNEGESGPVRTGEEAPPEGFEPSTRRLTAGCSTAELQGNR
jgi:integrase